MSANMYEICESPNFMWSNQHCLGEGATATVYQGVSKLSGDSVAVKCYKRYITQPECQLREFEMMKKIKHENIVKLIAVEENLADRKKVLITELCNGGSLLTDLMDPKNTFGLEESEFLLVLRHLYGGMKYLRDNNIVHRDLKPGNIMKCIQEDGTNIYKLTDFGAARELAESETFQSLCGTPQYLHPDVYERAILGRGANKKFNSSVDLWSIGVTLYHIATGILPFIAYNGYKHKETMHYITTKKESGVLSGIQIRENGPITWSRTLPDTCFLSDVLKENITPIIAGVVEANLCKIWGFEKFFNEVDILLSHIVLHIFYVNKAKLIKIYMLPEQRYKDLEQYITKETGIEGVNQLLLHKSNSLQNYVEEFTGVCEYPKTSEDHPLFLFNKENEGFTMASLQIPTWVDFPTNISIQHDIEQATTACSIGYYCKRQIDKYSLYCKLINDSVESLIEYIDKDLKYIQLKAQHLFDKVGVYKKTGRILQFFWQINKSNNNSDSKLENMSKEFTAVTELVAQSYNLQCFENTIKSNWDSTIKNLNCPVKTCASTRGKTQIEELRKSWQYFTKQPIIPHLSCSKSQWHILERNRVRQRLNNIKILLEKETFPHYQQAAKSFENWYLSTQNMCFKINVLRSDINNYEKKLKDFENELTLVYDNYMKNKDQLFRNKVKAEIIKKIKHCELHLGDSFNNKENFDEILSENMRLMRKIKDFKCVEL
ncbi:inhibitor of nuclear factor kappa-B kinase subunit epsilon-like [Anoplophora glabripennis]|uniref:inhibitor of nuclear factor kappa-B kinase subunit epsilon-like n=1 Tax=Anoplophora glabripennis TaxID=217634 RepID=UPI0008740AB4|nr:inhibitor of nuclear factor kappa-B kinase subunit epsilon-like [Anoplophora glabripennis]